MTHKLQTIGIAVIVAIAILGLALFLSWNSRPTEVLAGFQIQTVGFATTSKSQSVTTSAVILATTTNPLSPDGSYVRLATTICNPSTNPVYISANQGRATNLTSGGATMAVAAAAGYDACWHFTQETFPYNGALTASSTNGTATVLYITDYVQ